MSLLLSPERMRERRALATGALAPLAGGLAAELAPVVAGRVEIPAEKALLSRTGGRCPRDGAYLRFDPFDTRHLCPRCGIQVVDQLHDRFRPYWYQLWLAERIVHASLLGELLADDRLSETAASLLDAYADRYLDYPNQDNVLGPSRPFFSTYLESVWLLQIVIALDLLESGRGGRRWTTLGGRVRSRIIEPSAALIASYDEGLSNRQAWNDAALLAAGTTLGQQRLVDHALHGRSGVTALLEQGLLADGSWYEGENYHLFAHRGLWYAVTMAEQLGHSIPRALLARFQEGFAAPFRTLLPDLTLPSRRDSQYAVSIRQPRFAEMCELGLARADDARLVRVLSRLYDVDVPPGDTGRRESTADVERNLPACRLTRADLSWRSLLFARESLPDAPPQPFESDLLPEQGIAILRREEGRVFVALDFGHPGGGHGHPDRLNLLLSDGDIRWFDDPGTGSYVDPSLHWYRSTLAHTAPLIDGRSQPPVHGELLAFEDGDEVGWVSARAELAPGCVVHRTVLMLRDYLLDRVSWESDSAHEIALPFHGLRVVEPVDAGGEAEQVPVEGGESASDGFGFLHDSARLAISDGTVVRLEARAGDASRRNTLHGWIAAGHDSVWWRAVAPGPPEREPRSLLLVRCVGRREAITSVWSWRDAIDSVTVDRSSDELRVVRRDGGVHLFRPRDDRWQLELDGTTRQLSMTGELARQVRSGGPHAEELARSTRDAVHALPARFELAEEHYRRSEQTWVEAGRPSAIVSITRATGSWGAPGTVIVEVLVPASSRCFVPLDTENPFDNEPASINGDGVQLYLAVDERRAGRLLVPVDASDRVEMRPIDGWRDELSIDATWAPVADGYRVIIRAQASLGARELALDLLVNETAPGRTRRRGQLVLSGAAGEFVYLRGDRHDRERLLRFSLADD